VPESPIAEARKALKATRKRRPLKGIEALTPDKRVLVVSSAALEAARRLFGPRFTVLSWTGGVATTDWEPLYGRSVDLWPDASNQGDMLVAGIVEILLPRLADPGQELRVMMQEERRDGWNLSNALEEGWDMAQVAAHAKRDNEKHIRVLKGGPRQELQELQVGRPHDGKPPIEASATAAQELQLRANSGGVPYATMANASIIVQKHPELAGKIWFDTFRQQIRTTIDGSEREWTDADDSNVTVWLQQQMDMNKIGLSLVKEAVEHAARCKPVNSVIAWLNSLEWDEQPRLCTWLSDCLGVPVDPYSEAVGRNWLVSMVARAFKPGCQADHMPVLEGKMGTGKSSLLALLGDPWFSALPEAFGSKDFFQAIQGQWLIEVPDMTGFSKREHSHIIAVITTRNDRYRASYGRRTENHPRQCTFTATSETDDYLQDSRGIRRYWPLRCTSIDLEALSAQRPQLFAEATALYKAGATWYQMPGSALVEQTERRNEDVWREQVLLYCAGRADVTAQEVLQDCLEFKLDAMNQNHKSRIGAILREDGYRQYVATRKGMRMRVWTKQDKSQRPLAIEKETGEF
jgi:predicted P-loop ATPase